MASKKSGCGGCLMLVVAIPIALVIVSVVNRNPTDPAINGQPPPPATQNPVAPKSAPQSANVAADQFGKLGYPNEKMAAVFPSGGGIFIWTCKRESDWIEMLGAELDLMEKGGTIAESRLRSFLPPEKYWSWRQELRCKFWRKAWIAGRSG
jgi:hypothetical protein